MMKLVVLAAVLFAPAALAQEAAAPATAKTYEQGVCDGYNEAVTMLQGRAKVFADFINGAGQSDSAPWVGAGAGMTVLAPIPPKQGC